jgi:hypothetical protein
MRTILARACGGSGSPSAVRNLSRARSPVPPEGIVVTHPQGRQHGANTIDQADPLSRQILALPDTPAFVLIGFVGNRHHRANARLAPKPGQHRAQQQFGVDPIGFRAPRAAVNRNAGRLNNVRLHTMPCQPACQPEPRPAGLVDGDHPVDRSPCRLGPVTVTANGRQQRLGVRLNGLLRLDSRQAGNLRCQNPTRIAQLDREHERGFVVQGVRMEK